METNASKYADGAPDDELGSKRRLFRAFEENKKREIEEARVARRYYNGRQWSEEEVRTLQRRKQPIITDNRIARKIDFLVGVEQRMRRDPRGYPRNPGDEQAADTATAGIRFVCETNRWEDKASACAHDGFVSGVGVVWVGVEGGPRGLDVRIKQGQIDRFFYDPRSVYPDFSDAKYMGMHLWLDVDDVKSEYPQFGKELDAMVDRDGGLSTLAADEDREEQWGDFERRRVRVVEMYQKKSLAPSKQGFAWYFCKFSGALMLESMWSPYLDENGMPDCPYVAWSPYVDERGDRYGLVRNMRPMQDEINHRRSKLLHRSNVKQIHMRDGVIEDVDQTREELTKPDGVIKHQGTWGQDIGIVDQSTEMRGESELLAQAQASLENLGPNPGLIGKGGGVADQSGRAILAQRDSGMTELSPVFDRLRDWKLRVYRKVWARIKHTWTGERWVRITDDKEAPAYLGINRYEMGPDGQIQAQNVISEIDVDVILEEGPDTIIMQEELMQTFSQLGEAAAGPLGKIMIELSSVPNKDRLLKMLEQAAAPDPQVQQLQQRMAELEAAMQQAKIAQITADTEAKRVDSTIKIAQSMIPPQAIPGMYPIPFRDGPQPMQPPEPPQMPPELMGQQLPPDMMQQPAEQMPGQLPVGGPFSAELSSGMSAGVASPA